MVHKDPVNWKRIRVMPLIARMIDGALDDTREHLEQAYRCALDHRVPRIARLGS